MAVVAHKATTRDATPKMSVRCRDIVSPLCCYVDSFGRLLNQRHVFWVSLALEESAERYVGEKCGFENGGTLWREMIECQQEFI